MRQNRLRLDSIINEAISKVASQTERKNEIVGALDNIVGTLFNIQKDKFFEQFETDVEFSDESEALEMIKKAMSLLEDASDLLGN